MGWLGFLSLFIAPIFILNNTFRWLFTLGMKEGHGPGAPVPANEHPTLALTPDVELKLMPYTQQIMELMDAGTPTEKIADAIAPRANVSAVQAELFIQKMEK